MNDVGAVIDFVRIVGTQLSVVQIEYLIGENIERLLFDRAAEKYGTLVLR